MEEIELLLENVDLTKIPETDYIELKDWSETFGDEVLFGGSIFISTNKVVFVSNSGRVIEKYVCEHCNKIGGHFPGCEVNQLANISSSKSKNNEQNRYKFPKTGDVFTKSS